jgi:transcriptional regulator with PAS, ATPase and Fis domain
MKSYLVDHDSHEKARWRFEAETPGRRRVRELAQKAARSSCPVLILGPTGVGKEVLAEDIHRNSDRATGPFISVNCAAITPSLFESELFGHIRGSFTGAASDKAGLVEIADGGVLFLDEVGELSAEAQAKLLRFLAKGTYWPVGSTRERRADVRVIAATHRRIDEAVGTYFREDLFYRLSVVVIRILPLEPDDTRLISRSMAVDSMVRYGVPVSLPDVERLSQRCSARAWRGGARELRNIIERFFVLRDPARTVEENWAELFGEEEGGVEIGVRPTPPGPEVIKHLDSLIFLEIAQECRDVRDLARRMDRTVQAIYGRLRKLGLGPEDVGPTAALTDVRRRVKQDVKPCVPWIQSILKG